MGRLGKHNANKHEAVVGGQRCKFDSMAEHRYAEWLERQKLARKIADWRHHDDVAELVVNGKLIAKMKPDFTVFPKRGHAYWDEVKGKPERSWVILRKLMAALHPEWTYNVIDAGRGVCASGTGSPALFDERPKRKRRKRGQ